MYRKGNQILDSLDEAVELLLDIGLPEQARSLQGLRRSVATDVNNRLIELFNGNKGLVEEPRGSDIRSSAPKTDR